MNKTEYNSSQLVHEKEIKFIYYRLRIDVGRRQGITKTRCCHFIKGEGGGI